MTPPTTNAMFPIHAPEAAPAGSQPALARLRQEVGAIPNLAATMATSPTLIEAFVTLRAVFHEQSTLSRADRELVFLTNAVENGCAYCTAIHTAFGLQEGVSSATVAAVRARSVPADARQAALVDFDRKLLRNRGRIESADLERFLAAGFSTVQALELIAAAAISTLANYSGRFTQAPLDVFLESHAVAAAS